MIFDIQYKEPKVFDGYSIAGEVLLLPELVERVRDVNFTYLDTPSWHVPRDLEFYSKKTTDIPVIDYYYKNARVIGKTNGTGTIFINRNGVKRRSVVDYFRNALHEFSHDPMGFGHGSNWMQDTWKGRLMCRLLGEKEDKNLSVPCQLEVIALDLAKEKGWIK